MEIEGDSLDDTLMRLYADITQTGTPNEGSRGNTLELLGVSLRLRNPRSRLSRSENRGKAFSALGELLWYLSGRNDLTFIGEYVPAYARDVENDGNIHGGYGPRLFAMRGQVNQLISVANLLKQKPKTRRAVIQLFNAEDLTAPYKEVPCTTTMQFFQRHDRLHLATTLRSNDAYKGLPHDVFCFTMLQEMMARRLGVEVGEYYQYVGSMHIYTDNLANVEAYIGEGHHKVAEMPSMPEGDPFPHAEQLLLCERRMREGEYFDASTCFSDPYWADLTRLLQAYWASGMDDRLDELLCSFVHHIYRPYAETRRGMQPRAFQQPTKRI